MRRSISTRRGKDGTGVNIREISLAGAAGSSLCRAISGAARASCSTSCGRMGGAAGSPKIFSTSTGGGGVGTDQDCGVCAGGTGGAHPPAAGLVSAARAACAARPASAAARAASAVARARASSAACASSTARASAPGGFRGARRIGGPGGFERARGLLEAATLLGLFRGLLRACRLCGAGGLLRGLGRGLRGAHGLRDPLAFGGALHGRGTFGLLREAQLLHGRAALLGSAVGRRGLEDLLFLHLRGKLLRARFGGACRLLRRAR